jgi:cytochrome P450
MTGRPELVRQIFAAPVEQYGVDHEPGPTRVLGAAGVMAIAGRSLRRDRKLLVPAFHGEGLNAMGEAIRKLALDTFGKHRPGEEFVVRETAWTFARDVVLQAIFGIDTPERMTVFRKAAVALSECFEYPAILLHIAFHFDVGWLPPYRRLSLARARLDALLQDMIDHVRGEAPLNGAVLSRVVAARYDDGTPMSDVAIRDNMITTLIAGQESSVASLCWCFYWLHRERHCLDRLLDELAPLGPDADPVAWARLPYLDAVVKETLRLWPRATEVYRLLAQPMSLGGYELPAGTNIAASPAILHYDPDLYPDPDSFRPERFLERRFAPHEYIPFGGGERLCPGSHLSTFEMKIVLATLLTRWTYTLLDQEPIRTRRMIALRAPSTGVRLRIDGPRR